MIRIEKGLKLKTLDQVRHWQGCRAWLEIYYQEKAERGQKDED